MRLTSLRFSTLAIPFTERFRHASADRAETSSAWVTAHTADGTTGVGESCPRPYVTGESLDTAAQFFRDHVDDVVRAVTDVASLRAWGVEHAESIDHHPAAWCAIELALLDAIGRTNGETLEATLGMPALRGPFMYSAVLGDGSLEGFDRQLQRYLSMGFRDIKVKVSGDPTRDYPKLERLADTAGVRVRLDANNLWPTAAAAITFLGDAPCPLFALEEPLSASDVEGMARIADATGLAVVLDESTSTVAHVERLRALALPWIINVRVSKMGGVLRSLDVVHAAREAGLRVIVGAQVGETSVLTRAALPVAEAARPVLEAQEGAFGTLLLSRDVCEPPLMFGAGGRLAVSDHPCLLRAGLGLDVLPPT